MATVVKHRKTGISYVLLGTGFGAFESQKPNWLFGELLADKSEGSYSMACVCDEEGKIVWVESSQLVVESVDGKSAKEILGS